MTSFLKSFSLVGDSNVKRGMSPSNIAGRPLQCGAQVIIGGRLSVLSASLSSVRQESDACVVASITNILANSAPSSSSPGARIEKALGEFFEKVIAFAFDRPSLHVFILPPMYRTSPVWFREGMSEIMLKFSSAASGLQPLPANLHLMSSFSKPVLESDGVHLTPYSGMEFALHLFDEPERIIRSLASVLEIRVTQHDEDIRLLKDRVLVLEQDHKRLNARTEMQFAIDQELADFQQNLRDEVFFMISGLPRLPRLEPSEWQTRVRADVNKILSTLGFSHTVQHVFNSTGRGQDPKVHYKVRMESAEISRSIRDKFGSFFSKGGNTKPAELANISIRNCVTTATLARIAILQLLGKRHVAANAGSRSQVVGFEPRPLLKLFPAPDAKDKRVLTFNFIEAVSKLPTSFDQEEIADLMRRISPRLHGNLKALLIVVSDDMLKKRGITKQSVPDAASGSESGPSPPSRVRPSKRGASAAAGGPSAKK